MLFAGFNDELIEHEYPTCEAAQTTFFMILIFIPYQAAESESYDRKGVPVQWTQSIILNLNRSGWLNYLTSSDSSSPNPLKHHQLYTFTQLMVPSLLILTWLSFYGVTKIHVTTQTPGVTSWPFADTQTLNPGSEINHGKQQFLRPRVGFMSSISHNYYLSDPCKNPNRQESVWMLGRPWPRRWPVPALHLSFHLRAFRQGQHHKIIQEGQKLD